jgi:signal transduction histidine kinase
MTVDQETDQLMEELQKIPTLAGLPDEVLSWLIERGEEIRLQPNEILMQEGSPADRMVIMLEGEVNARIERGEWDGRFFTIQAGQVSGMLPFSRMTTFSLTGRALIPTRILRLDVSYFPEMTARFPALVQRLVETLIDRTRDVTQMNERFDKLRALGKLSAGLAHELNNPAAAVRRASQQLGSDLDDLNSLCLSLKGHELTPDKIEFLTAFQRKASACLTAAPALDTVAQSECEDEITEWLDARGVVDGWEIAPTFVRAGMSLEKLEKFAAMVDGPALPDSLRWLSAAWSASELVKEIEQSATRISELVKAIKDYTYMDRSPLQDVDIHQGIENTLIILSHKLKRGVNVIREYEDHLPRISAYGGALNQIWTNLIDNAIDAMNGRGNLWIRTASGPDYVQVEINDDGPGIPPEIQGRIFDPFFTTKPQGEGTGLGLDTVYQIIRKHHGEIRVQSKPGDTCFCVRLPLSFQMTKGQ